MRELTPDPFPYSFYVSYLNTPEVQAAIGAFQNFSESSEAVYEAFTATGDDNREYGTVAALRKLVEQNVTVMLYAGDADYKLVRISHPCEHALLTLKRSCNWLGNEAVSDEVNAPGFSCAGYVNVATSDSIVHGQVKQAGKFSFVRVYESGHEVPFYQPLASLEIFERAITGKDIATGSENPSDGYLTVGTTKSEYREGNSTIQFEVLPSNSTYNYTTGAPNMQETLKRRGMGMLSREKRFKPGY